MSLNASLPILEPPDSNRMTVVDVDAVMNDISIVLYSIIVVIGITGNSMVIWVAGFKLKQGVTNVWLVNLAIADLIFCFTRVFSLAKKIYLDNWPFGIFLCKVSSFVTYSNMFCSVFLLAMISLDRALCIWQPVFTRRRRTVRAAKVVAVCVWGVAAAFSVPYFTYRQIYHKSNLTICALIESDGAEAALYTIRFLFGFLLPFIIILICYILAGIGIRRTRLVRKSRPLRIIVLLVVAFFVCWAPYHCLLLVKMVNSTSMVVKIILPVAKGMAYFNSCLNPLLYLCMGLHVRGQLRQNLAEVYKRALADDTDEQTTQCNKCSLDNSESKQMSVVESGMSQATMVDVAEV
ncbi:C3a anaphylatoxin chemotactic receptor-like [Clinocottus analis]|uniref:C3a anaphylatoxin chemotactic receptor-like n=1 Tax=Clinocottus analis TaxID=304258 RepID=UPI0035C03BE7